MGCFVGMKASQTALAWSVRLQIALGIAQALNYLHHECSPCIVHQNVTSRNVLIDDNMDAKLTDIGLLQFARTCRSKVVMASLARSGYAAPEFAQAGSISEKIDVYSFGVMLLELLTGRKPADFLQKPEANTLPDWVSLCQVHCLWQHICLILNETFVTLGTCGLLEKEKELNLNLFFILDMFWSSICV